jgi:FixJ family two-component response regulator
MKKLLAALRERFESLSPREREIMIQVARGRLNKQIAGPSRSCVQPRESGAGV